MTAPEGHANATLRFDAPVALVGAGAFDWPTFHLAAARVDAVVAADGGANWFDPETGLFDTRPPLAGVIGDMDSVADLQAWRAASGCAVVEITEQNTTDLEKCLYTVAAPLYLGVGFLGARLDHSLAALHALISPAGRRAILLGETDVVFLAPRVCRLALRPGARVSLFPLRPGRGVASSGLAWPIDGLAFETGAQIGTSNHAVAETVVFETEGEGLLVVLDRSDLDAAIAALSGDGS